MMDEWLDEVRDAVADALTQFCATPERSIEAADAVLAVLSGEVVVKAPVRQLADWWAGQNEQPSGTTARLDRCARELYKAMGELDRVVPLDSLR
jgi:hypothetical protein